MKGRRVAVLGGGIVGLATAAEFANAGFEVNLFELPEFKRNIQQIAEKKEIRYSGVVGSGAARVNMATTDIGEALQDAKLVLFATPAFSHEAFVNASLPHLQDGQILTVETAYFFCLRFVQRVRKTGKDVILAEMNQAPYCATRKGPAEIFIDAKREKTQVAALPAKYTKEAMAPAMEVYKELTPAPNVIETSLYNVNWVIHPAVTLLHRGLIDRSVDFSMPVKDSLAVSVVRLMDAVENERLALGRKFGIELTPIKNTYELGGVDLEDALRKSTEFQTFQWEFNNGTNQYLKEDLLFALPAISSLAKLAHVPTPAIDSVAQLLSIVDGVDYFKQGATVENMGLSGKSVNDILKLVNEGC